jgi:hypothetical protein
MAIQINFTFDSTTQRDRIVNAFALAYGYKAKLENGSDNPQSKRQFFEQQVREYVRSVVQAAEQEDAAATARKAKREQQANDTDF